MDRITRFRENEISEIIKFYNSGKSTPKIAKLFNTSHSVILRYLKQNNVPIRSHSDSHRRIFFNKYAFDILSPSAKYWVGFIFADGHIGTYIKGKGNPVIRIEIAIQDINHLVKYKEFVNSSHKLSIHKGHGYANAQDTCSVQIRSKDLVDKLISFGCGNKLNNKISNDFVNSADFWRGMIDADGYVSISNNIPQVSLSGGFPIVSQFLQFIKNIAPTCKASVLPNKTIHRVTTNSFPARQIIATLYRDATVYLDRKMEIAQKIIQG